METQRGKEVAFPREASWKGLQPSGTWCNEEEFVRWPSRRERRQLRRPARICESHAEMRTKALTSHIRRKQRRESRRAEMESRRETWASLGHLLHGAAVDMHSGRHGCF